LCHNTPAREAPHVKGRIVLLVLLLAAGLFALRGPLALRVMDRVLARTLGADPIAELPDGLHVLLCGAGGPLPDPLRSGPCAAVIAGRSMVVVDAGTGGARNLQRLGFAPGRSEAQFLTHFHSDHIDGLGEMAMLRWTGAGHDTPLPVYGPAGVEEVVAGFGRAYQRDSTYRTAHHGPVVTPPSAPV
jgi:ribonuclease Z